MASKQTMQQDELRRGQWLEEEDESLVMIVAILGECRWDDIAKASGIIRYVEMLNFIVLKQSRNSCQIRGSRFRISVIYVYIFSLLCMYNIV